MLKNRRTLLYGAVIIVGVSFLGDQGYRRLYESPLRTREDSGVRLTDRFRARRLEWAKAKRTIARLDHLQERSLPADLEMARSCYQTWLLELIGRSGWQSPNLDSSAPIPHKGLLHRLSFTVHGRASLDQITDFLHEFYGAGFLHKIRGITLNPTSESNMLDASLTIDTLVLPGANNTDKLSAPELESPLVRPQDDYQVIAQRNIFRSGGGALLAQRIVLRAVTSDVRQRKQAWFNVGKTRKTHFVGVGESLTVESLEVEVIELYDDEALIRVDGQRQRIFLGQSLAEAQLVAAAD